MNAPCLCCKADLEKNKDSKNKLPRICPLCDHDFQGNGWDGIDAHWRSKHEQLMPYREFWAGLCPAHKGN